MSALTNRPEIDGLRAVAVISVILFHANMRFTGGYVGVDVFFVISGYLITSLILHQLNSDSFRLIEFWERRVRRILPALVLVVLASLGVAWFMLFPVDFDKFGQAVAAQGLLLSNVYYWKETGYFSPTAVQPLLHTWSLALEEQFYLLFPLFLIALTRFNRRSLVWVIGGSALLSFTLSAYGTYTHPLAAFYLLPFRAWELLLGALLAAMPAIGKPVRWLNEASGAAGLTGIFIAAILYTKETRFPGFAALLPCLGAGAIIWSTGPVRTFVGRMLSLRPLVFVGLISYSLYLWHWPMLVFSAYWAPGQLSLSTRITVIAASFVVSILSWKSIETPFRKRTVLSRRTGVFAFAGGASATLVLAGFLIFHGHGFAARWRPDALQYLAGQEQQDFRAELDLTAIQTGRLTEIGLKGAGQPIDLLVWGDSHAMAVLHILNQMCIEHRVRGVAATHSSTVPLLDLPSSSKYSLREGSIPYNQAVVDYINTRHVKNVLLAGVWDFYLPSTADERVKEDFRHALVRTIKELQKTVTTIFIMKDVPHQPFDVPRILAIAAERGQDPTILGVPLIEQRTRGVYVNGLLDSLASASVVVLDPVPLLTDQTGICPAERNGRALYFDNNHLSIDGAIQLRPLFQTVFRNLGSTLNAKVHRK
jgi:peptidoglycan/LPS O-acetylase OafA/YrhL